MLLKGAAITFREAFKVAHGKSSDVRPMMWIASVAFVVYFAIFYVRGWVT